MPNKIQVLLIPKKGNGLTTHWKAYNPNDREPK